MKPIALFLMLALLAFACQKEPYPQYDDSQYLVYTAPAKDVHFADYLTFNIADSVLVIGQSDKPQYSQSDNAMILIQAYRTNMENAGYVYTASSMEADLGIHLTYVVNTRRYINYYNNPYWWLEYPGYWPSDYWGNWIDWYYPFPVTYTYTTNALIADISDLTLEQGDDKKLKIVWSCYIGGPASYSIKNDVARMKNSVNQAFVQSPYLTRTATDK